MARLHRTIQKDHHDPNNHDGVITQLEPDILECEVKWALRSITVNKANGGDGIPIEPFQILKDDAVKVLHSTCQQIWTTQQWPQDWKGQYTFALISHASKVILKILQARLQQYVNQELPDVQGGFRKGRGTRGQIANICWILEKTENSRKTSTSASLTTLKAFDCVDHNKLENSSRDWNTRPPDLPPKKSVCRLRSYN